MRHLSFRDELFHAAGGTIAMFEHAHDVGEVAVALVAARMEEPGVVWGPQLIGRYKLLQAVQWRNGFIIPFFGRRAARRAILIAEPVIRRAPHVGSVHVNPGPE